MKECAQNYQTKYKKTNTFTRAHPSARNMRPCQDEGYKNEIKISKSKCLLAAVTVKPIPLGRLGGVCWCGRWVALNKHKVLLYYRPLGRGGSAHRGTDYY